MCRANLTRPGSIYFADQLTDLVLGNELASYLTAHARSFGSEHLTVDHALLTAGFHVDRVRDRAEDVHIDWAAAVTGQFNAETIRYRCDLHPLARPTRAPVVRLNDVG